MNGAHAQEQIDVLENRVKVLIYALEMVKDVMDALRVSIDTLEEVSELQSNSIDRLLKFEKAVNKHTIINYAEQIWEILDVYCGVGDRMRSNFVSRFCDGEILEHQFQGSLRSVKFWITGNKWYVTCYPENNDKEKTATIDNINELLLNMKRRFDVDTEHIRYYVGL